MPTLADFFKGSIQQGLENGGKVAASAANDPTVGNLLAGKQRGQQESALSAQNARQQGALSAQESGQQAQAYTGKQAADLATFQKLKDSGLLNSGGSLKVGDINAGKDPLSQYMLGQTKAEASARKGAIDLYNKGAADISKNADSAEGIMQAVGDNDKTSIGRIRTGMVRTFFNRYNDNEGMANMPKDVKSQVMNALNSVGIPSVGDGNLNATTKAAAAQFAKHTLDNADQKHQALQQGAQQSYGGQTFANQAGMEAIGKLGGPLNNRLGSVRQKYFPQQQTTPGGAYTPKQMKNAKTGATATSSSPQDEAEMSAEGYQ